MTTAPGTLPRGERFEVGEVIAGKYCVQRVVGRGGMGVVMAAQHLRLRQTVAIKLLLPKALEKPGLSERMLREARAAAALKGEHVARVYDVDVLDDGSPYIVMEYLEGQTLAALLKQEGPLEQGRLVDCALQICEALAEAHAHGIVHRDLKPANLHLAQGPGGRDRLRVLDFGIAKALDVEWRDSMLADTDSHAFIGSPPYVSPEQLLSPAEVDARTDIWSIGVVLYECLSGKPPFRGETLARLWDAILRDEPAPISMGDQKIEPALEQIVRRCLEKKQAGRYATVLELARALADFAPRPAQSSLEAIQASLAGSRRVETVEREPRQAVELGSGSEDNTQTEAPLTRALKSQVVASKKGRFPRLAVVLLAAGALIASLGVRLVSSGVQGGDTPGIPSEQSSMGAAALSARVAATPPVATLVEAPSRIQTAAPSATAGAPPKLHPEEPAKRAARNTAAPSAARNLTGAPAPQKSSAKYVDER